MKLSLSTGTLYIYPLRAVMRWARAAGFAGVELVVNPEAIGLGGRAVARLAAEEGIEVLTAHPTVVPLPGWREKSAGGLDRTLTLAHEAGAGLVVVHTPRATSLETGEGLAFRQQIERLLPRLRANGLQVAVENKAARTAADARYALTPLDRLRDFAERYDLGLVLDTTHAGASGEDLVRAWQVLGPRLVNVHLSDVGGLLARLPARRLRSAMGEHRFPGAGHLPLSTLLTSLDGDGYAGPVTLEVNPFALRFWWPPAVRRRLAEAAAWIKAAAEREA